MRKVFNEIKSISFGQWSLAMFTIAVVSGVVLMVPFDVTAPYRSVAAMMIAKPYALLVRNMHFWSSQLFLVFLFIHLYDYFKKKEPVRLNTGVWLRLTFGLIIIFLLMFTGFLLRADADAIQAKEIFESLVKEIPLLGNVLSFFLLGREDSWQIIYLNHAAVFTVLAVFIIFEHSRKIWPSLLSFVLSSLLVLIISFLFSAPLHDGRNPTVKGPWYFVGLQDLLHRLTHPQWILVVIAVVLIFVYLAGDAKRKIYFPARRILLFLSLIYGVLTIDGFFLHGENWKTIMPWEQDYYHQVFGGSHLQKVSFNTGKFSQKLTQTPLIDGKPEGCLLCHDNTEGFSPSHNPEAVGCFACHGGNPLTADKNQAHKGMILIPGNLSDAGKSCGTANCHPQITERINSSLMTNLTGMISVDRYVFGEKDTPDDTVSINDLHHSPADEHLKNLCVRCHLGNEKHKTGPVNEESRGGGCLACHLNYNDKALKAYNAHLKNSKDSAYLKYHASVDMNVTNDHCFGCHSRSGRISTNYEGWHETLLTPEVAQRKKDYRVVENSRVFRYVKDDVHHALGLECVDCHTSYELMGDGKKYRHQEQQQDVACYDCHTLKPDVVEAEKVDAESAIIAALRFGDISGKKFVRTHKHKKPLSNVFVSNDSLVLIGKNSGKKFLIKPPSKLCQRDNVHKNVSCSACHSAWAPTCIGCHNAYDSREPGYDMIENIEKKGSWVEFVGTYQALPPALGIRKSDNKQEIIPVIPGMILSIDLSSFDKKIHDSLLFRRLYAPASPHTVAAVGRSCRSCHNNPSALGYGKGKLNYVVTGNKGVWKFFPGYKNNKHDGLPEDAWIPFLGYRQGYVSTRTDVFPLDIEKQKKILTVGACLTCHNENSQVMKQALFDFEGTLKNKTKQCILPFR